MAERAAIVTGASSGIGLAIAEVLAGEGYALTVVARRPETLSEAAARLRTGGTQVVEVPADLAQEGGAAEVVARHADRHGRLDVLVNSAGLARGAGIAETETPHVDLQLAVNLRSIILLYREATPLLRAAGSALVVNLASIAGKSGQAWLSVYSATKAGVVAFTQAMNRELGPDGVKSVALCPGFVDTPMPDWVKGEVPPEAMIRPADVAEAVRFLLRLSPACVVPEIVFDRARARR